MDKSNVVELRKPEQIEDPLTEVLRHGARALLAQAIEVEVQAFVTEHAGLKDDSGRRRVVRNGYLPDRQIQTGIGSVPVKTPRVRDRQARDSKEPIRFSSKILPPYLRRTKSLEELIPWLYLKGISTGDFSEALAALLGPNAPGLSASTISRLKEVWKSELKSWQSRDLSGKRYVYFWADGIYFNVRLEQANQCILVIIGATADGQKELLGLWDGYRESEQSWRELLLDLKRRGLTQRVPNCRSAMVGWASGRPWFRFTVKAVASAAGSTRRPTFFKSFPRALRSGPRGSFMTSGWPRRGKKPRRPLTTL